VLFSFINKCFY